MEQARPFLSVNEIADLLGVDPRTVRGLIRDEVLPAHRIGKEYRIQRDEFEEFLRKTRTTKNEDSLALVG